MKGRHAIYTVSYELNNNKFYLLAQILKKFIMTQVFEGTRHDFSRKGFSVLSNFRRKTFKLILPLRYDKRRIGANNVFNKQIANKSAASFSLQKGKKWFRRFERGPLKGCGCRNNVECLKGILTILLVYFFDKREIILM